MVEGADGSVIELVQGTARLRLAPHLGGRVTALRLAPPGVAAAEILHPFPEDTTDLLRWPKGGLYPLVPYWGRIRDSLVSTETGAVALLPHPDAAPHTLHGPAHRHPWRATSSDATSATLAYAHPGDAEWPWPFRATLDIALPAAERCVIGLTIENTGGAAMPAGLGLHPYFAAAGATRLVLTGAQEWPMDAAMLSLPTPSGPLAWDGPLEGPVTRQASGWGGRALLRRPGLDVALKASPELACLVLHRPANADWLCLEPVTHVADAFNLAAAGVECTGARTLASGERLAVRLVMEAAAARH
jgi:aldose 1-epimerase